MRGLLCGLMLVGLLLGGCQTLPERAPLAPPELSARDLNDRGVQLLREGKLDEAFILFQKAIALDPQYARAHFNLALIYYQKGLLDLEIQAYQRAIAADPEYFYAHLNLAHAYLARGDTQAAAREYAWVLNRNPRHPRALYNLAVIRLEEGRLQEAQELLQRYLLEDSDSPWADRARAMLADLKQRLPEASMGGDAP